MISSRFHASTVWPGRVGRFLLACLVLGVAPAALADEVPAGSLATPVSESEPLITVTSGYHSEIDRAWFGAGPRLDDRAESVERRALELGSGDVEHAARALISPHAPGNPMRNTRLATRLAPELPIAHLAEARALWGEGHELEAAKVLIHAAAAVPRHLEASLWLAASLLAVFAAVALLGSFFFIAGQAATVFSHAAHDAGDLLSPSMPSFARAALLSSFLLVPILLGQGLLGFALGLFLVGFGYGSRSQRVSLALAAMLIVLALFPLSRGVGIALGAFGADPVANASYAVVRGTETRADIEMLQIVASDDLLAEQALALRARRTGDLEEAELRYSKLLAGRTGDPVVSTNLANLKFRQGDTGAAIALYEQAAGRTSSAIVLFNLSQAYARDFRMDDFEATMRVVQGMAPETARALSRSGDASFVADLPLPIALIRERMVSAASGEEFQKSLASIVAPGPLGSVWWATAAGFALVALLAALVGSRYEHSSRCGRCGRRICGRCDGTYWNSEICDPCHHLYHQPETTDPAARTERLAVLRRREARLDRVALGLSVLLPGAAGFFARRPDYAFMGILLFLLAAAMLFWRNGIVPDPLAVGALGPVGFTLAAIFALLVYAGVVLSCLLIRRSH